MITKDREYRNFDFKPDDDTEKRVEGVAVVFNEPTLMYELDGVKYYEEIDKEAFKNAKIDDVVLNIDHTGKPAAKTRNGTLDIKVRDTDVFISADLSRNATGRELYEDIQNGFYERMSFAFTVAEQAYDKETRTRRITKIDRLYDVSAVTVPAYDQTSIYARSFFEAEAEKEVAEANLIELKKEKLKLRMKLEKESKHGN